MIFQEANSNSKELFQHFRSSAVGEELNNNVTSSNFQSMFQHFLVIGNAHNESLSELFRMFNIKNTFICSKCSLKYELFSFCLNIYRREYKIVFLIMINITTVCLMINCTLMMLVTVRLDWEQTLVHLQFHLQSQQNKFTKPDLN